MYIHLFNGVLRFGLRDDSSDIEQNYWKLCIFCSNSPAILLIGLHEQIPVVIPI